MTEIPPMVPSVPERITAFLKAGQTVVQFKHQIETAYRDGFTAGVQAERNSADRDQINYDEGRRFERAAIIAMLREPKQPDLDDALDEVFWEAWVAAKDENARVHGVEPKYAGVASAQFLPQLRRALADHLESQPSQNSDDN